MSFPSLIWSSVIPMELILPWTAERPQQAEMWTHLPSWGISSGWQGSRAGDGCPDTEGMWHFSASCKSAAPAWVFSSRGDLPRAVYLQEMWQLMGLGSKLFYLWSPECGAGSLSQKHPHTPSLRQNLFVPERETYYGSNSCRAIRKRKVHESDSVGLPATLNMVINHARY